jgi:hypothetical protein
MRLVTIRSAILAAAVLIVPSLLLMPAANVTAQILPPPEWDHYLPFYVDPPYTWVEAIELDDQFGTSTHHQFVLTQFALPVDKNQEGIYDDILHYTWWEIFNEEEGRDVFVDNQFGTQLLHVTNARYLWNPALKNANSADGSTVPTPPDANHYKCYEASGQPVGLEVSLGHQFDPGIHTQVLEPELFCNPTEKLHLDTGLQNNIHQLDRHYVCYRIEPPVTLGFQIGFADQFLFDEFLNLDVSELLCVPTLKTGFVQTEESSWGKLKAIYR